METPPLGLPPADGTAAQKSAPNGGAFGAQGDFDTFLQMLTTQIKNQDPLNPMESTDFATQLATFSGVEQQVQTNELLRSLGAGGSLGGLGEHANWVGMSARLDETVDFDGSARLLHFELPPGSVQATLVVSSADGQELRRRDVSGVESPYAWDGRNATGEPLLAGRYRLAVETVDGAGRATTVPVATYTEISEVRTGAEGPEIVLADGRRVAPAEVSALRAD